MGELFNGQLQSIALVDEDGGTIENKLNGAAVANEECGLGRAGTLTFIGPAFAAAFAGTLPQAIRVSRAGGAWLTQAARRNKCGLVLAINGDQWVRHFLSSRVWSKALVGPKHFYGDNQDCWRNDAAGVYSGVVF